MIGTIITFAGGIYAGLYLAKKGVSFDKASAPVRKACGKARNFVCSIFKEEK